ncbi:hypothetical protein HPB52_017212 [Rhipicephalus sanguineus]|uniref:Oxidoreductase FAD/NAD(P)-binding domain-containing protein n=1 Tax=Rhipicephalus sanguineus TaxID=34632 RepID=A0A9D4SSY9_RHISA|nr:hypothetical protein HPB52_017212 [Rhipicephalus sanguineus]
MLPLSEHFDACTRQPLLLLAAGAGILILWARHNAVSPEKSARLLKNIHRDYIVLLKERLKVTHNTVLLRFELPSQDPVQGPKGKFEYAGRGRFVMESDSMLCIAWHIGLVAAGTGVTPMLQLLRHMFADVNAFTRVSMVDVNHSEEDIIMHKELDEYAQHQRRTFRLCHVLTKMPQRSRPLPTHAQYLAGPLTKAIMEEFLPQPSSYSVILLEVCQPALRNIGHDRQRVLVY